jgi:hypothetical protein
MLDLGTLRGDSSEAFAIGPFGQIVGDSATVGSAPWSWPIMR